jgi:predicted permease
MQFLSRMKSLTRNLLRKPEVEGDLEEELQSYAAMLTDEKVAAGISHSEARRSTLAELGGIEHIKQSVRDRRTGITFELLWQDVRYALRQLARNRAFSFTAVLTLALGIGATTAIFSAVYALLLRPLPYPDSGRLVYLSAKSPVMRADVLLSQDFVAAQTTLKSFREIAGYNFMIQNLTGAGDPVRVTRAGITANLFPVLGAAPSLGRLFTSNDERPDGPPYVVLSDRLWRSQFHADPQVIGKTLALDGEQQIIIGVAPQRFSFPDLTLDPDLYVLLDLPRDTDLAASKISLGISTLGLLRQGVSRQQAQTELQTFFLARAHAAPPIFAHFLAGREAEVTPLQQHIAGDNRQALLILLACVAAVLLIACANVANLQLARAVSRRHETALRGTLGASRLRLVKQFLVESLVLSSLAATLGLTLAWILTSLVRYSGTIDPSKPESRFAQLVQIPFGKLSASFGINAWVLAFTIGLALATTVLFGLIPAITGSRLDLRTALQSAAMRISQGRDLRFLRHSLLVIEVALAVVLLSSSGLLIRSFVNVMRYDSGFDPSNTLTATTLLYSPRYTTPGQATRNFITDLLTRLRALPGVEAASVASAMPLEFAGSTAVTFGPPMPPPPAAARQNATAVSVTPDYFRVVGNPILQGRAFTPDDTANSQLVAIVNQAFAKRYFDGKAVGRQFNRFVGTNQFAAVTIVGIAQDLRHNGLEQEIAPEFYIPEEQAPSGEVNIALRSAADPTLLANAMRKAVLAVDSQQPLFDIETMDQRVANQVAQRRLIMLLVACFALLAVILSAVGVYGVFAYSLSQRRQEMGVRLALGASRGRLIGLIVTQAARLIAVGGILGITGAFLLNRLLTSMLVGIKAHDALSFSLAWLLMTTIALLASIIPASHAARTDLISVLHSE